MNHDIGMIGTHDRRGFMVGRLVLGAVLVALLGSLVVLAVGHPSLWTGGGTGSHGSGGGSSGFAAAPARMQADALPSAQAAALAVPTAAAASPIDEFGPTTEARGFISAQLSVFASMTQVWEGGLMSREDVDAAGIQSADGVAPVINDLRAQPMNGGYALSRTALLYGLRAVDQMWRTTVQNGTVDALDYQVAQASLEVSARYAPGVPPAQS